MRSNVAAAAEPLNLWIFDRDDCRRGRSFPNLGGASGNVVRAGATTPPPAFIRQSDLGALLRNGSGTRETTVCLDGRGVRSLPNLPVDTGVVLESARTVSGLARLSDDEVDEGSNDNKEDDSGSLRGLWVVRQTSEPSSRTEDGDQAKGQEQSESQVGGGLIVVKGEKSAWDPR